MEDTIVKNRLGVNGLVSREVLIDGTDCVSDCTKASSYLQGFSNRNSFSTEKYVMDYDLPELVVFLQEDNHQFVKDICIDRGVINCGYLLEDCEVDHSSISSIHNPDVESTSESSEESLKTSSSKSSNGSKCIVEHHRIKDVSKWYGAENLMMEGKIDFDSTDENSTDHSTKTNTSQTLREILSKEAVLEDPMVLSKTETNINKYNTSKARFQTRLDHRRISHLDSPTWLISSGNDIYCKQPPETGSMSKYEDENSESLTGSSKSFDQQHYLEESEATSFAIDPHTGPLTIPGSASHHRSNSSMGSAHSFAFPILTAEWSGSPVRMETADRRQLQKHRRWRIRFLCCKF
ncbi:18S pre-ribosomal assembly protein gar2-like protein [Quillaja saponaria]|uniref:18S pre-ribosomal assembly protein gar2-like protein n=1 Tax=Quillaja saponaria TaxID=32244 RepID=A0AAD7KLU2_QUISA|nr:18S pre-ribosomal assembly protein gar2-like protein [Quillaja saponaria]